MKHSANLLRPLSLAITFSLSFSASAATTSAAIIASSLSPIGHPGGATFSQFASASGYACKGATLPFVPYFLSTLDPIAWRYGVPESVYPEALIPGMREVGSLFTASNWGNLYPRSGFLNQVDDYKTGAVIAQRAGDITTRLGQVHVYQPMRAMPMPGYWPAGELREGLALTGKWQELTPTPNPTCATFPSIMPNIDSVSGGYAWALWRPYSCCQQLAHDHHRAR